VSTPILKLSPIDCLSLRGFDDRGASAALHDAAADSFKVSGSFKDSADFAVLVLWDADNYYEHPRLKYLPDFGFAGVTLSFDVTYSGLMALDSSLYPTIAWPYLEVVKSDGTTAQVRLVAAAGGSGSTWHVTVDFTASGITSIRQMWMTFAPPIPSGVAYTGGEWQAVFTNWTVTGGNTALKVAGPGSVRMEEYDSWCTFTGAWATEAGFYSKGFAAATTTGGAVTVRYLCASAHDLYLGTSLYLDRGVWAVSVDGGAETSLACYLSAEPAVNTRRLLRSAVSAGEHVVTLRHAGGGPVYFDFLEAAVLSDVPDPDQVYTDRCPASDYGTDHTYKPSAARFVRALDRMGFMGPLSVYVSVFWWNERVPSGRVIPVATVTVPAAAVTPGYNVFISISGGAFGRYVIVGDTPTTVAAAIAAAVNVTAVGVYATSSGPDITITNRSAGAAYAFDLLAWYETPARVDIPVVCSLRGGIPGTWVIDPAARPTLNRGAREWLADLCRTCAAAGRELWLSYSMELLNPPADWAARFPGGTAVTTSTGFGPNITTHCAFMSGVLDYQRAVYAETAAIMVAAGLPARLQFGEFTWWYFAGPGGMGFYDTGTKTAAFGVLGRPLHTFTGPNDDPSANAYADVDFLRSRLVSHCAAIRNHVRGIYPGALFEILLPLDVNYPEVYGRYSLGGRLLYYINVPDEFKDPARAPFDRVLMEGLDFGSGSRDFDKALRAMRFPYTEGTWPLSSCRYLVAAFNGGCPWPMELLAALGEGLTVRDWAIDHVGIFGWDLNPPLDGRSLQEA